MRIFWVTAAALLLDQVTKQIVLRTMYRGQSIPVLGDWLKLTFTENDGMAFGISFGPEGTVTALATVATLLIVVYLYQVRNSYLPYRLSLALVLGGALGNIVDRVFYGVIYEYGSLFNGHVVDFIHVDAWRGMVADWVPFIGGKFMMLFPIWNVADMAIVGGVIGILVFQNTFHEQMMAEQAAREADDLGEDGYPETAEDHVPAESEPVGGPLSMEDEEAEGDSVTPLPDPAPSAEEGDEPRPATS